MPILISQESGVQLLGVPKISSATGQDMADAIFRTIDDWNVKADIVGISFDITNSNSGQYAGAAVILERLFEKCLLPLACRHHLYEIMLRGAYEARFGSTSGPSPTIFDRFDSQWNNIDQSQYESGIQNDYIRRNLQDVNADIIQFCQVELKKNIIRDDYRELLELTLIFLGFNFFSGNVHFRTPGARHHARWMSKALYALKIFMFLKVFSVSPRDKIALTHFCLFVVRFYVKAWTRCPIAVEAPQQDLNFLKSIHAYAETDQEISTVVTKKFGTHLWYLNDETIALAFFDDTVSVEDKRKMCETLLNQPEKDDSTRVFRLIIPPSRMTNINEWKLNDFITENTITFFERFNFPMNFMSKDPSIWNNDEEYKRIQQSLATLQVVNDHAERAVKLFSDYNNSLTKDEKGKQYLMQVVNKYRKDFPGISKSDLSLI